MAIMLAFFLFLIVVVHAADVHLWASAPIATWTTRGDLDAACNAEYAGSIALVCTSGRDVATYFLESSNVTTWAGANIATAGTVNSQLFGGTLGTSIVTFSGGSTGTDNIATSCNSTGNFISGTGCGSSSYASRTGNSGFATSAGNWLSVPLTGSCVATYRVYCIEGPFVTSAPTKAPTRAPTRVPTTAAPTLTPTTAAPTRVPTTLAPTRVPTTRAPSRAPTRQPTGAPTTSPTTVAPTTGSPTATACATCTAVITPGPDPNVTNFMDYKIGPPGNTATVVLPPGSVPNCAVCTVLAAAFPVSQGPPMPEPASSLMLRFEVYDGAVERGGNVNLSAPVNFLMPYPQELVNCNHDIVGQCVWWTGADWSPSGCTSSMKLTGTLCLCSHFTIFAVQLDPSAVHPCRARLAPSLVYQAFAGVYGFVGLYSLIAICVLLKTGVKTHLEAMVVHSLVCLDAVLRVLGCVSYMGLWGDEPALGLFVAIPYALEYYLVSRVTASWSELVPFAMLSADMRWRRVKKYFLLLDILGLLLSVGLFAIYMQSGSFLSILSVSYTAVVLVTFALAGLYIASSLGYWVYSVKILIEMKKGEGGLSIVVSRSVLAPFGAIRVFGRAAAVLFVIQGAVGILAVGIADQFVVWISISFSANVLALFFTLSTYWRLCAKQTGGSAKSVGTKTSSTELGQLQQREASPYERDGSGRSAPPVSSFGAGGSRPPPPSAFPSQSVAVSSHTIAPVSQAEAAQDTDYSPNAMGKHRPCKSCGAMLDPCAMVCSSCGQTPETRDCPRCGLAISSKYLNCVACGSRLSVFV